MGQVQVWKMMFLHEKKNTIALRKILYHSNSRPVYCTPLTLRVAVTLNWYCCPSCSPDTTPEETLDEKLTLTVQQTVL